MSLDKWKHSLPPMADCEFPRGISDDGVYVYINFGGDPFVTSQTPLKMPPSRTNPFVSCTLWPAANNDQLRVRLADAFIYPVARVAQRGRKCGAASNQNIACDPHGMHWDRSMPPG
ncbi:hypothetical protein GE09DRAFT_1049433 [Coniochaeta sp. 2T2.1]|nr:hypothetical protein GE09DRAFT_1049433 [Coniochaeta sp. 2T2.1]